MKFIQIIILMLLSSCSSIPEAQELTSTIGNETTILKVKVKSI